MATTKRDDVENMVLAQRAKIGRYSFMIYRNADRGREREYRLYAKQGSELRMLLKRVCGFAPDKEALVASVTSFICSSCPGVRPSKVRSIIGD